MEWSDPISKDTLYVMLQHTEFAPLHLSETHYSSNIILISHISIHFNVLHDLKKKKNSRRPHLL